jgi:hypothetical protein
MINRREWLAGAALLAAGSSASVGSQTKRYQSARLPALFNDIEYRTFRFFRNTTVRGSGLAPDRWPSVPFASIAATGFALTALPIGVERGWMTRAAARTRTLATLRFLWNAPQGDGVSGASGYKGFFYHFLDLGSGKRFGRSELSSVDTTLLLGGILFAGQWFDGPHPDEAEIRDLAQRIYARVDWRWMQKRGPLIAMGWRPESGFIDKDWRGYNEAMLVYLLALASPTFRVAPEAWSAWCSSYGDHWHGEGAARHLAFAPHFGHQYSHIWVDFRGIRDAAMREAGCDYFENSRRATHAQRAYAIHNPMGWDGYSADIWGLTACDGPADARMTTAGREQVFRRYSARGPRDFPDGFDDGTIAPTAAIASLPFAPEIVVPTTLALHRIHGKRIYGPYGFVDAFNPSFKEAKGELVTGTVDAVWGWVGNDLLGIDQGPILAMIANARDDLVWRTMRRSPILRLGLKRAGFIGGWLT